MSGKTRNLGVGVKRRDGETLRMRKAILGGKRRAGGRGRSACAQRKGEATRMRRATGAETSACAERGGGAAHARCGSGPLGANIRVPPCAILVAGGGDASNMAAPKRP